MKNVTIMIKPASSLCNLRCRYCFYADVASHREIESFGIMQDSVADRIIENVYSCLEPGDTVSFAFQGGEPTLAGISWFEAFFAKTEKKRNGIATDYALQTNSVLLNDDFCRLLKKYDVLVGISLDGPSDIHNANRVESSGKGTHNAVMAAKKLLDKHGVRYNVLMTLTSSMARHPDQVWKFIKKNDIRYVQFTPCIGDIDGFDSRYAITPERFASFYRRIFGLWYADWKREAYTSVKLIDDLVNLAAFGERNACGITGRCGTQVVVESDGSTYPCDFYMLDSYRTGNLAEQSLSEIMSSETGRVFASETGDVRLCRSCPYLQLCGGGCKRMHKYTCYASDDIECAYRKLLDSIGPDISSVAIEQRSVLSPLSP